MSIRAPRIRVVQTRKDDAIIASAAQMIAAAIRRRMAEPSISEETDADAVISIGGTGAGQKDAAVIDIVARRQGRISRHRSDAGRNGGDRRSERQAGAARPGRIDAALACWLMLGRRMFARLAGGDVG